MWCSSSARIVLEAGSRSGGVAVLAAQRDARLQPLDHLDLDGQVGLELLADGLPDAQREQPLVVRQAVEAAGSGR